MGGGGKKIVTLDLAGDSGERINSPRSLEACLRTGIEPDELLPKSPKDFWDRRGKYGLVEKQAATIRFQHFEQLRLAKLDAVRKERDAILAEYEGACLPSMAARPSSSSPARAAGFGRAKSAGPLSRGGARGGHHSIKSPSSNGDAYGDDGEDGDEDNSTMVQLEERRLQRMKMRQQKEIQNVIENESKMAKMQLENAKRNADEVRKKLDYQKELRLKRAQLVAQKHARDLEKQQMEENEEKQRKLRAKQEAEKEQKIQQDELLKQQERKKLATLNEMERNQKAEEFRKQTEQLLQQQEDVVSQNRQKMVEKEKYVLQKMEIASKRRHYEALEKRERANARISHANAQNQQLLQQRKHDFDIKQRAAQDRAKEIQEKTISELKERANFQKKEEEIRQKRLEAARKHQQDAVSKILTKRSILETKLEQLSMEKEKERLLQNVEKELSQDEKLKNVERIKRIEEYSRLQMMQKIAHEDEKSRKIKQKRHKLMEERQKVALDSLLRKHKITQAMEKLRLSNKWDKIDETLGEVDQGHQLPGAWQGSGHDG